VILHICTHDEWAVAEAEGVHAPASLDDVGFVHCSDFGTVHLPANALFAGRTDLLLLVIDPASLDATVRWEEGVPANPAGVCFPHVYGPIPTAAVIGVVDFPPPKELAEL